MDLELPLHVSQAVRAQFLSDLALVVLVRELRDRPDFAFDVVGLQRRGPGPGEDLAGDQPRLVLGDGASHAFVAATEEDAASHYDHALQMNANMGARPWVAHTEHDYARMLAARSEPGDRERALELTRSSREHYRNLDMDAFAIEAAQLERTLSAVGARREPAPPEQRRAQKGDGWPAVP